MIKLYFHHTLLLKYWLPFLWVNSGFSGLLSSLDNDLIDELLFFLSKDIEDRLSFLQTYRSDLCLGEIYFFIPRVG